jgi:hypothetical protein
VLHDVVAAGQELHAVLEVRLLEFGELGFELFLGEVRGPFLQGPAAVVPGVAVNGEPVRVLFDDGGSAFADGDEDVLHIPHVWGTAGKAHRCRFAH